MNANNITIGINLGDRRHTVCVLSAAGDIVAEETIANTRESQAKGVKPSKRGQDEYAAIQCEMPLAHTILDLTTYPASS